MAGACPLSVTHHCKQYLQQRYRRLKVSGWEGAAVEAFHARCPDRLIGRAPTGSSDRPAVWLTVASFAAKLLGRGRVCQGDEAEEGHCQRAEANHGVGRDA